MAETEHRLILNSDGLLVDLETGEVIDDSQFVYNNPIEWYREREAGIPARPKLSYMIHDYGVHTIVTGDERLARAQKRILAENKGRSLTKTLQLYNMLCHSYGLSGDICNIVARAARQFIRREPLKIRQMPEEMAELMIYVAAHMAGRADIILEIERNKDKKKRDRLGKYLLRFSRYGIKASDRLVSSYIHYIMGHVGAGHEEALLAERLAYPLLRELKTVPRRSVAALASYVILALRGYEVTQTKIAKIVHVTDATIRNTMRKAKIEIHYIEEDGTRHIWTQHTIDGKPHNLGVFSPAIYARIFGCTNAEFGEIRINPPRLIEVNVKCAE